MELLYYEIQNSATAAPLTGSRFRFCINPQKEGSKEVLCAGRACAQHEHSEFEQKSGGNASMKKRTTRCLALLLAVVMVLSVMPVAMAEETT